MIFHWAVIVTSPAGIVLISLSHPLKEEPFFVGVLGYVILLLYSTLLTSGEVPLLKQNVRVYELVTQCERAIVGTVLNCGIIPDE